MTEMQELDDWLRAELRPTDEVVARVRRRLHGVGPTASAPASRRWPVWAPYAAAAAIVVASLGAGFLGSRLQPPDRFTTTVLPPQPTAGTSASSAAAGAMYQDFSISAARGAPPSTPIYYGSCSAAPTVQLQGRGVTATGFAEIASPAPGESMVNLGIQAQSADASAAATAAETKAGAVEAALTKLGMTSDQVQQVSFNLYTYQPNQTTAYISLQVRVAGETDVAKVIKTAVDAGATSAFSGNQLPPQGGSDTEVQDAVSRATSQAKTMATATATAAGIQLAQLQTVVAQPPQLCYGPSGPQRVVAVTVTYSVK